MKCPSCSRTDGTHSEGCHRPARKPRSQRVRDHGAGMLTYRFEVEEVDRRPINGLALSLLAELHESFGDES